MTEQRYAPSFTLPKKAYTPGLSSPHLKQLFDFKPFQNAEFVESSNWHQNLTYLFGIDLFNAGFFWEAHEIWGLYMRQCKGLDPDQFHHMKLLIQLAAACLHHLAGRDRNAQFTWNRAKKGYGTLSESKSETFMGTDLGAIFNQFPFQKETFDVPNIVLVFP